MKIRCDFVTNSSSTAFILIRKSELTRDGIARLIGVSEGSPLKAVADDLHDRLRSTRWSLESYYSKYEEMEGDPLSHLEKDFSKVVADRVRAAKDSGATIEMGTFRSDGDGMESFFCTDSFELENDEYYVNALRCSW